MRERLATMPLVPLTVILHAEGPVGWFAYAVALALAIAVGTLMYRLNATRAFQENVPLRLAVLTGLVAGAAIVGYGAIWLAERTFLH